MPSNRAVNNIGTLSPLQRFGRIGMPRRVLPDSLIPIIQRICPGEFDLRLPIAINDMVPTNPQQPANQRSGIDSIGRQTPVNFDKDLLGQIFGFVEAPDIPVSKIVDASMVGADKSLPHSLFAG